MVLVVLVAFLLPQPVAQVVLVVPSRLPTLMQPQPVTLPLLVALVVLVALVLALGPVVLVVLVVPLIRQR